MITVENKKEKNNFFLTLLKKIIDNKLLKKRIKLIY